MKLLAIETVSDQCSVALNINGECQQIIAAEPRSHTENLLPNIQQLLAAAELSLSQLDGIAFGRGPGAFTGVRIGASVVQGLAFGADLPCLPISSLAGLAYGAYRQSQQSTVVAAFDARMGEIYVAQYRLQQGVAELCGAEQVCKPEQFVPDSTFNGLLGAGLGWQTYAQELAVCCPTVHSTYATLEPEALDIAMLAAEPYRLGLGVAPEQALPVYLRNNVAKKPKAKPL